MAYRQDRVLYLDGLRGLAALAVVFFHFFYFFLPATIMGVGPDKLGSAELGWLHGSLLYGFVSGSFAVALFFVLSGFVLGFPYCEHREQGLLRRAIYRRYPRLALPILATSLIYGLLLATGMISRDVLVQASALTGAVDTETLFTPAMGWLTIIRHALWDVFQSIRYDLNPVLWTMHIEMLGSVLVFGLLLFFGRQKARWWIYGLLTLICLWRYPLFLAFVLGLVLCEAHLQNRLSWLRSPGMQGLLLALVLYLAAIPTHPFSFYTETPAYAWVGQLGWLPIENRRWLVLVVAATTLIGVLLYQGRLQKLLESPPILFLGRISFSLYLIHLAVLYSVGAPLFLWLVVAGGLSRFGAVLVIFAICIPACLGAAWLLARWVDEPAIRLSRHCAKTLDRAFQARPRSSPPQATPKPESPAS